MSEMKEIWDTAVPKRNISRWKPVAATALLVTAALSLPLPFHLPLWPRRPASPVASNEVTWSDIPASQNLTWHSCYGGQFDCARLDVPMDWLEPTDDLRVVLAVIRLPATDRKNYRGPVFFNPGGPGGSGVFAMRDHGQLLQDVVGNSYDIITFDPRGIGATVPRIDCWNSNQNRHFWNLQDVGVVDAHPGTIYEAYTRMAAYSNTCEAAMEASQILRHSSTASHARDMLEILHQLGEDKLKYWGFSYGTVLGGTFAAMYPDKIERLVSDGNVDYREWYDKKHLNFLRDTDNVMQAFFDLCHQAGPDRCAVYSPTPAAIRQRLDSLLSSLKLRPVVVAPDEASGPEMPEIVTYSRMQRLISSVLYQPQRTFERFAKLLLALENGDGRPFYDWYATPGASNTICEAETVPPTVPLAGSDEGNDDATPAIMCSDSVPLEGTVDSFVKLIDTYQQMSYAAGAVSALFPILCVDRKVRAKWRFSGPFEGNTSFPILYIANIADNVTPLISARNNSAGFPSSVVLVQQSYGHTSLSAPSTCTAKAIRDYFQHGIVPVTDTECQPDMLPFGLPSGKPTDAVEDAELSLAIRRLSQKVDGIQMGIMRRLQPF